MTGPRSGQLSDVQGVVEAHTVGLADGGLGLPLLGWSTAGGDLRIEHFVGMHALQALPLLVLLLERLSGKAPALLNARRRSRLVLLATATLAATVVLLTSQALIGQSIVADSGKLEATLNEYAAEGWRVVNTLLLTGSSSITTVLERDTD